MRFHVKSVGERVQRIYRHILHALFNMDNHASRDSRFKRKLALGDFLFLPNLTNPLSELFPKGI